MPRSLALLTLCFVLAAFLAGPAAARPLLLISTENPAEHVQTRIVQRFVERVRDCCAERIDVEYRYGAQMFRDRDVLTALSEGKVGMALPGTWQLDRAVPDVGVFMLPVAYGRSEEDIARIQDSPLVGELSRQIEDALGVVALGRWIALGHADLFTTGKPVGDVTGLAGLRIRSPGGLANEWRLDALGARPVTIAWSDVFHALEDGRLDGLLTTFATLGAADLWNRNVRYVLEDHQYFSFYAPLVSGYVWRGLDEATRRDLRAAWEAGVEDGRAAMRQAQDEARARARAAGIIVATPSPQRTVAVRARLLAGQPDIADRIGIDPAMIDAVAAALGDPAPDGPVSGGPASGGPVQ